MLGPAWPGPSALAPDTPDKITQAAANRDYCEQDPEADGEQESDGASQGAAPEGRPSTPPSWKAVASALVPFCGERESVPGRLPAGVDEVQHRLLREHEEPGRGSVRPGQRAGQGPGEGELPLQLQVLPVPPTPSMLLVMQAPLVLANTVTGICAIHMQCCVS